ncbi:MAG: nucleotidyltransferase family protein [Candidatus Omnitrophica bacterium]|nr:nucleotidyltransferase family protein [Candidatus Omnitrophota bacterium]
MKALILAAGYGTRLYPYTRFLPKPLLKVNKRPIIEYLLDKLIELDGLSEIIVVTNDRFFKRFGVWRETLPFKRRVRILNDMTKNPKERLGAAGDMNFVFRKAGFDEDYLVLGGDNFFKAPLTDFAGTGRKNAPHMTVGVFDIKDRQEAGHYGVVTIGRGNRIVKFAEKPTHPESSLIAMCLYYMPAEKSDLIGKYFRTSNSKDAIGLFINWMTKQDTVFGSTFHDFWIDIGRIQTYRKLKSLFEKA